MLLAPIRLSLLRKRDGALIHVRVIRGETDVK